MTHSKAYALAELLDHMINKVEEVMQKHEELTEVVEELEILKKHIAEKLIPDDVNL